MIQPIAVVANDGIPFMDRLPLFQPLVLPNHSLQDAGQLEKYFEKKITALSGIMDAISFQMQELQVRKLLLQQVSRPT
jgi:hypothetical protein